MHKKSHSLLAGRYNAALTKDEIRRVTNTFLGLDPTVSVRYEAGVATAFRVRQDQDTHEEYGEIVFGSDIYPGPSVVDPNSALTMIAAAAHELAHFHRWKDRQELNDEKLTHIDEAMTSLQAAMRYEAQLNQTDRRLLVSDAMQRLQIHLRELSEDPANQSK